MNEGINRRRAEPVVPAIGLNGKPSSKPVSQEDHQDFCQTWATTLENRHLLIILNLPKVVEWDMADASG